jgi:hypothetical protein
MYEDVFHRINDKNWCALRGTDRSVPKWRPLFHVAPRYFPLLSFRKYSATASE